MKNVLYRYRFDWHEDFQDARATLLLAVLAAEGLYGQARVRMDARYAIDPAILVLMIDAGTDVGEDINAIFTAFILREFGSDCLHVRRVEGLFTCGGQEGQS